MSDIAVNAEMINDRVKLLFHRLIARRLGHDPSLVEANRLRSEVDKLLARNDKLEAIQVSAEGAAATSEELERLRLDASVLRERVAELEVIAAQAGEAERRAVQEATDKTEELESIRRQVNDLRERNAELEAAKIRTEEAGQWAATQARTYEAASELFRGQRDELQERNAELKADLHAVDFMSLGVGVGRRARRGLARYSGS